LVVANLQHLAIPGDWIPGNLSVVTAMKDQPTFFLPVLVKQEHLVMLLDPAALRLLKKADRKKRKLMAEEGAAKKITQEGVERENLLY
jgi:hypothetical protein